MVKGIVAGFARQEKKEEKKMKNFVCKKCGKEVQLLKEGENPNPPVCCGEPMELKECCK